MTRDTQRQRADGTWTLTTDAMDDPYARRFTWPTWNRTITVLDEPRLFRRLPEFAGWTRAQHATVAQEYLTVAQQTAALHADTLRRYARVYGDHGSLISGGFREHWPDDVKDICRQIAHDVTRYRDYAQAHWRASGRRLTTFRRILH